MATIRELLVKINGDNSGLNGALIKSGQDLEALKKNAKATSAVFMEFGKTLSVAVTAPIVAMGTAMVAAAAESEKATALLANSIKAVGNEGKVSVKSLSDFAGQLQRVTKYDDEVTLGALTMLEQLTALDEKGLKAILPSIQDFASAFGMDLQQAATLVGKTISSNTNALGKYGIQVDGSASQTEKLAQIMQGLARFQGTAAAEGKTFAGQLAILKNEAENLAESFGTILLPYLQKIISTMREVTAQFAALPEEQKKTILVIAALTASIGPLLLAVGEAIKVISALKVVLAAASGPTGWITLATVAAVALGVALATTIKKNIELQKIYSGESTAPLTNQLAAIEEQAKKTEKEYTDFVNKTKNLSLQNKKDLDKISLYGGEAGIKKEKERLERIREIQAATIDELKKKIKEQEGAQDELNGTNGTGTDVITDLTEAEKAYAAAMESAKGVINGNKTEIEKLGEQFDILQNTQTTNSADEETRLRAMAILREAIYKLQLEEMQGIIAENKKVQDSYQATYDYINKEVEEYRKNKLAEAQTIETSFLPTLNDMADAFSAISSKSSETQAAVGAFTKLATGLASGNGVAIVSSVQELQRLAGMSDDLGDALDTIVPPLLQIFRLVVDVGQVLTPGFLLLKAFLPVLEPLVVIIGNAAEALATIIEYGTDFIANILKPMTDWLKKISDGFKDWLEKIGLLKKEEKETTTATEEVAESASKAKLSIDELTDSFVALSIKLQKMPDNKWIKLFAGLIKTELKAALSESLTDALNEALIAGSYADFSQAIGKMVYSIASQFVLASIGLQPMIEKLSAMIVSALEDGAIDASEMSSIQAEAANIYNTASAALAPLQAIVNSTFGTSIGIPAGAGGGGEAIGSFASGVRNWRGGLARVGEQGPETVYLPRGASVEPAAAARGGATINIYSPKALDPMSARANMLAASRQLAFETGGNF